MCGIFGFINRGKGSNLLVRGVIEKLYEDSLWRGRDAHGYFYLKHNTDEIFYDKEVGDNLIVSAELQSADYCVFHTRAATDGSPQKEHNNHPIFSKNHKWILVHNGIVKKWAIEKTMNFKCDHDIEVDTQGIADALEILQARQHYPAGYNARRAFDIFRRGSIGSATCVMAEIADPFNLIFARNGHNGLHFVAYENFILFGSQPEWLKGLSTWHPNLGDYISYYELKDDDVGTYNVKSKKFTKEKAS